MTCVIEGCASTEGHSGRGLCSRHYHAAHRSGTLRQYPARVHLELDGWVNPLVCVCPEPDADPAATSANVPSADGNHSR